MNFILLFLEFLEENKSKSQELTTNAVRQLCEMGFPPNTAAKALALNKYAITRDMVIGHF